MQHHEEWSVNDVFRTKQGGEFVKKWFYSQKGQAMVEFALVLPLFLLIILFIIDFCWIAYQKSMFEECVIHASWDISADELGDMDPLEDVPARKVYSGATVKNSLLHSIQESSLWGLYPLRISVENATATLYNSETSFDVPGRKPTDIVSAISRTRHMDLQADLSYAVSPLTFIGRLVFGDNVQIEKHLECTRIISTQHRSE